MRKTRGSRAFHDLIVVVIVSLLTLTATLWIDPFARTVSWIYRHDNWKLDEFFTMVLVLVIGLGIYSWRRWRELVKEIHERKRVEEQTRTLNSTLESTLNEVRALRGFLRICELCQRIQDSSSSWVSLELYIQAKSEARFAHGLCPDCARKAYGGKALEPGTGTDRPRRT